MLYKRYGIREPNFRNGESYEPSDYFMDIAISLGEKCPEEGQHPVGAVVTALQPLINLDQGGEEQLYEVVVGVGANLVHNTSAAHAEMIAIEDAEMHLTRRRLGHACGVLYTTHEPCPMCAGAIVNSKLKGVVYGTSADDAKKLAEKTGMKWRSNKISGLDIIRGRDESGSNEQFVIGGVKREECLALLALSGTVAEHETGRDIRKMHYMG